VRLCASTSQGLKLTAPTACNAPLLLGPAVSPRGPYRARRAVNFSASSSLN
jgi:hypothetical protein